MASGLEHWLRLLYQKGLSLSQKRFLLTTLGSQDPAAVFVTPIAKLKALLEANPDEHTGKVSKAQKDLFALGANAKATIPLIDSTAQTIERDLNLLKQYEANFIGFTNPAFPELLNSIDNAPLGLFYQGNLALLNSPQVAIVGSRHASRQGHDTAQSFAGELSAAGITITSGLALGIDSHAHRGALTAKGNTIAVVATGLDQIYPARNQQLHGEIKQNGLIISEFPPQTPPRRQYFPRRNRIISGLALGTLVVEANVRSGSLITARLASEQGREVFAIPGSIHAPGSRGCHHLIRQGAVLTETVEDILKELAYDQGTQVKPTSQHQAEIPNLDPDHQTIFSLIEYNPSPIDQIIALSGLTPDQVSSILVSLELQGLIWETIGGYQRRKTVQ